MTFNLGKPILVMLVIAAICGAGIALRPAKSGRADLVLWTFVDYHAKTYRGDSTTPHPSLTELFQQRTGKSVDVQLVTNRAENVRLESIFMSGAAGPIVPDVVEIEIGEVGKFFRPPANDIGFLPLNDYLEQSGWKAKIIQSRFSPWSKNGVIYGVPHDVHPVTITYRDDLFREAGVDLSAAKTWPQFQELCLKFQDYWRAHGHPHRHAIELSNASSDHLTLMLLQRHINPIDQFGAIHLADPRVARLFAFYAQLVAGPRQIATQTGNVEGALSRDLNDGNICAFLTPDWRVTTIKNFTETDPATGQKTLAGKMRMMPLPIFEPGDAPTSTWGGTMMAIPRACPNPDLAWKLIELLYLSHEGFEARIRETQILPPVISLWNEPVFQRPDPFFGGQHVDQLFIQLARELPERHVAAASSVAATLMTAVLYRAVTYVEDHGADGLESQCQAWLQEAAADLEKRIQHGRLD